MSNYDWRCQVCASVNPALVATCANCGCPAEVSALEIEERKRLLENQPTPHSPEAVAETRFGKISVLQYRLFTANYGWLLMGPGAILSTGYWILSVLFGVASIALFTRNPVALWFRHETAWFARYYLGWSIAWVFLGLILYPSTDHMGLLFSFLMINLVHGFVVIPRWRELEKKLFQSSEAKG